MTHDLLKKLDGLGKNLEQYSLETVRMFHDDAARPRAITPVAVRAGHASPVAPASSAATSPTGSSSQGVEVVIVDDFRTGRREFLAERARAIARCTLVEGDVLDQRCSSEAIDGCDWVFHLQANADVRRGLEHPTRDLEQNTIATSNVLEAMRAAA